MSLEVLTIGGGGGASASIIVTGLGENNTVKATRKIPVLVAEHYTLLEYIESTGTQYIDLNFDTSTSMKFVSDVEYTSFYGDDYDWFIGNREAQTNWLAGYYSNKACYWAGDYKYAGNLSANTRTTLTVDFVTETFSSSVGSSVDFSTSNPSTYPARLFIGNSANFVKSPKCKCYGVTVYSNDTLVSNLVPVKRNSDNAIGLYDTKNDVFYSNEGAGEFIPGGEICEYGETLNGVQKNRTVTRYQSLIPHMTSDTTPSGVVSYRNTVNSSESYCAFDGKDNTMYGTAYPYTAGSDYVQYEFANEVEISKLRMKLYNDRAFTFTFLVSTDGTAWSTVCTMSRDTSLASGQIWREYELSTPVTAKYIRCRFDHWTDLTGNPAVLIELEAWGNVEVQEQVYEIAPIKEYGTWAVTATNDTKIATQDVLVDAAVEYEVELSYGFYSDFAQKDASWTEEGGSYTYGATGLCVAEGSTHGTVADGEWNNKILTIPCEINGSWVLEASMSMNSSSNNDLGKFIIHLVSSTSDEIFSIGRSDAWGATKSQYFHTAVHGVQVARTEETDTLNGVAKTIKAVYDGDILSVYLENERLYYEPQNLENIAYIQITAGGYQTYPITYMQLEYLKLNSATTSSVKWLYNEGDECEDVTGGWVGSTGGYVYSTASTGVTNGTKNSDNMYFPAGTTTNYCLGTNIKIDLTPYTTLHYVRLCAASELHQPWVAVLADGKDIDGSNRQNVSGYNAAQNVKEHGTIDISDVTGAYYIAAACTSSAGAGNVYQVWLE